MKQVPVSQRIPSEFEQENLSDTRLKGYSLLFARIAWVVIATLSIGLFLISLPSYFNYLHVPGTSSLSFPQLTASDVTTLHKFGLSLDFYAWLDISVYIVLLLVYVLVGVVLFWRKSDNRLALLASLSLVMFPIALGSQLVGTLPSAWILPAEVVELLGDICLGLFFAVFPNEWFVPRWTGWVMVTWTAEWTVSLFFPNSPLNNSWLFVILLPGNILFLIVMQVYRYRRVSTLVQRQQTKWVIMGIAFAFGTYVVGLTLDFTLLAQFFPQSSLITSLVLVFFLLLLLLFPLFLGFAILRYRLWDIDIIINRTLVYGSLTACIVGLYALVVGTLSSLLQAQGNFLISLLATGLVAVIFHPLRERLQRLVNRLFYGQRDEPYTVISQLGSRLEATLTPERVLPTIVETTARALKLPYVALALMQEKEEVLTISTGTPTNDLIHLPVRYQAEQLGELHLAPRSPGEIFSPVDVHLLEDLARQAGRAVYAMRLTSDLQRLAEELRQSRTQLVTAREEERRRLRRDLHDGLGSVLASLNLRAGAIRALLTRDIPAAQRLLDEQQSAIRTAITDIRHLVYELRPPSLDELGLLGALREKTTHYTTPMSTGLHVTIEAVEDLPPLSAAIEVAIYRIVQEALVNVERHAQARTCCVQLTVTAGVLQVEITDDGVGLSAKQPAGVGLQSMRERAAELSGTFQIRQAPVRGTCIQVRLPLEAE